MHSGWSSSSRLKSSNSTPEAFREYTLKLTPPGRTVAPRGELRPQLSTSFSTADDSLVVTVGSTRKSMDHFLCNCSLAAATTPSGSKPNFLCSSLSGAEAPKVFIPITWPDVPTYRSQPKVEACSTATRAFTLGGSTLSRYCCV